MKTKLKVLLEVYFNLLTCFPDDENLDKEKNKHF